MNTPEPFSQAWERPQQPGQLREKNTPYPSNGTFPSQMVQNQSSHQMSGMNGFPQQQQSPWGPGSPSTGFFPPPSAPFPASTAQPSSWNGAGMPNPTGNLGIPNPTSNPGRPNPTGNLGIPQTVRANSGYLPPSNAFAGSPTATNTWGNGANRTGELNDANWSAPPHTPIPPNNTPPPNTKLPRRNSSRIGKILLFLGLALLVVTVGTTGAYMFGGSVSLPGSLTKVKPTVQPTPTPTVHMQHQLLAKQYVAQMSLDDEIAQLLMVEHDSADYTDLVTMTSQLHIGSVILYKTAILTQSQVQTNIQNVQQNSKIPIFIAIDEEGWNVGRMGNLYPNYRTYRMDADDIHTTGDPNVASQQGAQTAKDMLALGINMNLAPDVDVSTDADYIGYDGRSFGSTPDDVIKYAGPYLKALQSNGVVGTIKHFPGLGSIPKGNDPHAILPEYTGTKDQLYKTDLVPFQHFIQDTDPYEQAQAIMPTDMLVPAIDPIYPAELSHTFITDILRNQMGFQGVIVSDSLHMGGVVVNGEGLTLASACVMALEAGNDILEGAATYEDVQAIISAIDAAVQSGKITKAQIDASVARVLTLKMDFNVMPAVPPSAATPTATPAQTPTH